MRAMYPKNVFFFSLCNDGDIAEWDDHNTFIGKQYKKVFSITPEIVSYGTAGGKTPNWIKVVINFADLLGDGTFDPSTVTGWVFGLEEDSKHETPDLDSNDNGSGAMYRADRTLINWIVFE